LAEQPNEGADVDLKVCRRKMTRTCGLSFWGASLIDSEIVRDDSEIVREIPKNTVFIY
jgi:hypothetical protein